MASKDRSKGDKGSMKTASKSLKEKRAAKRSKRAEHEGRANRSVDQTFGR